MIKGQKLESRSNQLAEFQLVPTGEINNNEGKKTSRKKVREKVNKLKQPRWESEKEKERDGKKNSQPS